MAGVSTDTQLYKNSNESCILLSKGPEIRQSTIQYASLLGRWDKQLVDQASDVPIIIFFCNILCKNPFN